MQSFSAKPWSGPDKLVIGIDIGTTQSAVSYSHLYTGGPRIVTRVGKWPGQPDQRGLTKIPSVLLYNSKEEAVFCGAEATTTDAKEEAEEQELQSAYHFKLNLHPEELRSKHKLKAERLPFGLTVERVYADFLRYLMAHTRKYFERRTTNGKAIWLDLVNSADIVMAHPNGWGPREQSVLRRAAIQSDLVLPSDANDRIRFVSEGEASVHFCIFHNNLAAERKEKPGMGDSIASQFFLQRGTKFIVCDAGGSTVDITSYVVTQRKPNLVIEEAKPSGCVQAGGIYVNREAQQQLRTVFGQLQIPRELMEEWLRSAEDDFETSLKPEFPRPNGRHSLTVDRASYNNKSAGVKNGRLGLSVAIVSSFFEPSIQQIIWAMREQLDGFDAKNIFLVGGFGESKHLQTQLKNAFAGLKCEFTIVEDGTAKAVSDGAVIWGCTETVDARMTRHSFGIDLNVRYEPDNIHHAGRETYVAPDGKTKVKNQWRTIVEQGTLIKGDICSPTRAHYDSLDDARTRLKSFRRTIYSFAGIPAPNMFLKDKQGVKTAGVERVCEITADLSKLVTALRSKEGPNGKYYRANYEIGITFGGTELKAYVQWEENGVKKRGPATIIPSGLL